MPLFEFNPIQPDSPQMKPPRYSTINRDAISKKSVQTTSIHNKENAHRGFSSVKPKAKDLLLGKPRVSPAKTRLWNQQRSTRLSNKHAQKPQAIEIDNSNNDIEHAKVGHAAEKADESESDDYEDWHDGRSLLEGLAPRKDLEPSDNKEKKLATVDELRAGFEHLAIALDNGLTASLVKALDQISGAHAIAEQAVDADLRRGMIKYCETSDHAFAFRGKVTQHLQENMDANQNTVRVLFQKLQAAYKKRNALWDDLNASLEQCANSASAVFDDLETSIRQTESSLEKKFKVLNHQSNPFGNGVLKSLMKKM